MNENNQIETMFQEMSVISTLVNTDSLRTAEPFKNLFPIREDIVNKIASDMKQHGFDRAHPIVVWSGHKSTVVDGHTRLLAAARLGFPKVPIVLKDFQSEEDALEYAIDSQRNRRNLTDAELMKCLSLLDRRRKAGRPRKGEPAIGRSAKQTAMLLGTSRGTVEKIRSLLDHAPEEIKDAVRSGNLTINRAYVITMKKVKTDKCRNEDEFRKARLEALGLDIGKIAQSRIEFELKRPPSIQLTRKEATELLKEISATLKIELDKLTQKGKHNESA